LLGCILRAKNVKRENINPTSVEQSVKRVNRDSSKAETVLMVACFAMPVGPPNQEKASVTHVEKVPIHQLVDAPRALSAPLGGALHPRVPLPVPFVHLDRLLKKMPPKHVPSAHKDTWPKTGPVDATLAHLGNTLKPWLTATTVVQGGIKLG
jgi:hypothetical protein